MIKTSQDHLKVFSSFFWPIFVVRCLVICLHTSLSCRLKSTDKTSLWVLPPRLSSRQRRTSKSLLVFVLPAVVCMSCFMYTKTPLSITNESTFPPKEFSVWLSFSCNRFFAVNLVFHSMS